MADDNEMVFGEMTPAEMGITTVNTVDFHAGFMDMPDSYPGSKTIDMMRVTFNTMLGAKHEVILLSEVAIEVQQHLTSWLNSLHEAGRCGCGEHEPPA